MLVLVVGPSGAGKDTLLEGARKALADDPRVCFARRVITRPGDAGGEAHEAVTEAEFASRDFLLRWTAHGLQYGIPAALAEKIARGITVIANVSRGVITEAAARFPVQVIEVTAPPDILAVRLAARGREVSADIAARLERRVALPAGILIETIVNDRLPEQGVARFLEVLNRVAANAPE
ncbi:MAG TPA: phosphonate metabolism protein/1,5-bisphosphokinase (PRPP-forming) PhnN [Acetobacteraceae bacterium]|jgi:phosphonate metabolism protein PhnN/1,5-bisphosphokinase (PRPP-forming)|nr:phosphonate metabolism protein/1,5-bisphosphokinase (PRPP-forming) PhnN [Acetobacteraceae bacterium]